MLLALVLARQALRPLLLLAVLFGLTGCDTARFVDRHRGRADYVLNATSFLVLLCKVFLFKLLELTLRFGLLLILLLRLFIFAFAALSLIQDDVSFLLYFLKDVIIII